MITIISKLLNLGAAQIISAAGLKVTDTRKNSVVSVAYAAELHEVNDLRQIAYVLATVAHECGFEPIPERRAKTGTEVWKMQERYWSSGYYGRGFPQLTWKKNYERFGKLMNLPLVENPDLLLNPNISAEVLIVGMKDGLFTGVKLSNYFNATKTDWVNARKIVNGSFMADRVATIAQNIYKIIS